MILFEKSNYLRRISSDVIIPCIELPANSYYNKSTKVLMPRWCWPKLHGLSIDHTAYMTAAIHIHARTALLQLLCTQAEQ